MVYQEAGVVIGAYVLGTIMPGYLITKWLKGVDVRKQGPIKNAGATSTEYALGKRWAYAVGIIDGLKGVAALLGVLWLGMHPVVAYLAAFAAVLGHRYPFWLGFKGGRGVATAGAASLTGLIALQNIYAATIFIIFVVYGTTVSPRFRKKYLRWK